MGAVRFNSKKFGELDFVIERSGYVLPVEIKSGKGYYRHNAMDNVLNQSDFGIEEGCVFCGGNIEQAGKNTYFPIHMLRFPGKKELPDEILFETDFSDLKDLKAHKGETRGDWKMNPLYDQMFNPQYVNHDYLYRLRQAK